MSVVAIFLPSFALVPDSDISLKAVYLRSISFIAQLSAFMALSASWIISFIIRWGSLSYETNSTCLGSTSIKRSSFGPYLEMRLTRSELRQMDLPLPEVPATRRWGIFLISGHTHTLSRFLPNANVSEFAFAFMNAGDIMTFFSPTTVRLIFGTSTERAPFAKLR